MLNSVRFAYDRNLCGVNETDKIEVHEWGKMKLGLTNAGKYYHKSQFSYPYSDKNSMCDATVYLLLIITSNKQLFHVQEKV